MSAPFIVGIGHVARVGKDTAADGLCRDLQFQRAGFADQLKELALVADPLITSRTGAVNVNVGHGRLKWVVQGMGWEAAKDTYSEVRPFLQRLGDGARIVFGDDFWVEQLFRSVLDGRHGDRVVIPDVRYVNEAARIQALGGVVIRIDRPGHVGQGHPSETELADWTGWDEEFSNSGTAAELQADVTGFVKNRLETKAKPKGS